jgi:hypothetical protein
LQENLYYFARTLSIEAFRNTAMEVTNEPQSASDARSSHPSERRDVRRAIEHWVRNTWGTDSIPLLDTFDFSPMKADWGHRFLICGDDAVEHAVFVTYGSAFAGLLGLPQKAVTTTPFVQQVPEPYRAMFSEGYTKVIIETGPVHLKGTFTKDRTFEFYRAVFLPIMLHPGWSKQLVFGTFNCRAMSSRGFSTIHHHIGIQLALRRTREGRVWPDL